MKTVKKAMAVLLAVVLMMPMTAFAATSSVQKTDISNKAATAKTTYNKSTQLPTVITVDGKQLVVGKDCVIVNSETSGKKNPGTYTITIKGIGNYSGTTEVTYTIKKAEQTVKTAVKKKTYSASSVKKKNKTFKLKTKAKSFKVTYKVKGKYVKKGTSRRNAKRAKKNAYARKYITVSANGKVTIKKGIKKGVYRIKVIVAGTKNYKATKKTIRIVID